MKFLSINTYHVDKLEDVAKATAKLNAEQLEGYLKFQKALLFARNLNYHHLPDSKIISICIAIT